MNSNKSQIQDLQNIIFDTLSSLITDDFVLLDVPNHRNIGDTLIWKGELLFFEKLNTKLIAQYNRNTFKKSFIKDDNTVILLHGGGNFGDIYSTSQKFKLEIIKSYPNNRIIILPQTVFYRNENKKSEDLNLMNKHKDLHICVRDYNSHKIIGEDFDTNKIYLLPDMAFFINLDNSISNETLNKNLFFKRTDSELGDNDNLKTVKKYCFNKVDDIKDWPTYTSSSTTLNTINNYIEAFESKISNNLKFFPGIYYIMDTAFGFKSKNNISKYLNVGTEFINNYNQIATTRLHGAIMCILLNKKVYILDNSYGKNSSFYETWLKEFKNVKLIKEI